jgi:hypothetical protein
MPSKAIKVFYSYAHEDEKLRDRLEVHLANLKRQGIITSWSNRDISAGSDWSQKINEQLNTAQIILLLISPDFIASEYCYEIEVKRALERHEAREACVIPIILRHASWRQTPLSKLQALPSNAKPVTDWPKRDKAFLDIEAGIFKAIQDRWPDMSRAEKTAELLRKDADKNLGRDNDTSNVSSNLAQSQKENISYHFKQSRDEAEVILSSPQATIGNFESGFDQKFLDGKIAAIMSDSDGDHLKSLIEADEAFYIDIAWQLQGQLASMVSGKWSVKLFFECLDASESDFEMPSNEVYTDLNPCGNGYYQVRIVIPAKTVQKGGSPYQVTAVLRYYKPCKIKRRSNDQDQAAFMPGSMLAIVTFPIIFFYSEEDLE